MLDNFPILLRTNSDKLQLIDGWLPVMAGPSVEPVADDGGKSFERPTKALAPAYSVPQKLTLRYYEPARDYQAGVQTSESVGTGRTVQHIELPAALDAQNARRISELQLLQAHRDRESFTAQCAVNSEPLSAGQWIIDPAGRNYQIQEIEHFRGSTRISARSSLAFDPTIALTASPGRNVATPDLEFGQTQVAIIDLPIFDTVDPGKTVVGIFANGTGSGWRRAALAVQQNDSLLDLGSTALPAIIGHSMNALPPHSPHLLDIGHSLDVQFAHDEIEIGQLTAEGAYCWSVGEFIRFGSAIPIAAGRYRLAELQRGCFGTETAIHGHQAGEPFVWLEQSTARLLESMALAPGSAVTIEATGFGDANPVSATISLTGKAIAPLSPVHAHGHVRTDGGVHLTWVRRSRIDFGWNDGVDQGLAEDAEQYLVSLWGDDGPLADWTVQSPELSLSPVLVAELNLAGGPVLTFQISQIGRHMTSSAVTVDVTVPS